jgi:hypothetical protein
VYQLPADAAVGPAVIVAAMTPATLLVWAVLCAVVAVVAIIRGLRQPAEDWPHGNWSMLGWVLLTVYLAPPLAGYPIPLGAIALRPSYDQRRSKPRPCLVCSS